MGEWGGRMRRDKKGLRRQGGAGVCLVAGMTYKPGAGLRRVAACGQAPFACAAPSDECQPCFECRRWNPVRQHPGTHHRAHPLLPCCGCA